MFTIRIDLTQGLQHAAGQVATAELHFTDAAGPLAGLKLIGFTVWQPKGGRGPNVTFPARHYAINGERRSFALLRPTVDTVQQQPIREAILEAYAAELERVTAIEATAAASKATANT
jgi:hypothetical protein